MKIEDVNFDFHVDYINKKVHLLEREKSGINQGLTNVISTDFQIQLVVKEFLLRDVIDFDWVLYCSNGLIFAFKNYSLNFVSRTEKWLYEPFTAVLAHR